MSSPLITGLIAADHVAQLRREACIARLVALARCCRPSTWARVVRHITRVGGRLRDVRPGRGAAPCCPGA